jgi:hypothetical protein
LTGSGALTAATAADRQERKQLLDLKMAIAAGHGPVMAALKAGDLGRAKELAAEFQAWSGGAGAPPTAAYGWR